MAYVTDFKKAPLDNLLGLINEANNLGLVPASVALRNLQAEVAPEGKTYNTSVEIDLLTNEVVDDFAKFTYKRVDLGTLFSLIVPGFRQVDVPLNESGVPADPAVLYAELLRKYGTAFTEADFSYSLKAPGVITLTAKDTNLMYIGSVDLQITSSLESRVKYTILDGFVVPVQQP